MALLNILKYPLYDSLYAYETFLAFLHTYIKHLIVGLNIMTQIIIQNIIIQTHISSKMISTFNLLSYFHRYYEILYIFLTLNITVTAVRSYIT